VILGYLQNAKDDKHYTIGNAITPEAEEEEEEELWVQRAPA
jgi:hypothetical protein